MAMDMMSEGAMTQPGTALAMFSHLIFTGGEVFVSISWFLYFVVASLQTHKN
jgi:hypothetical protein